ncbi:uncharacterized protein Tco025E_02836 [Trypanosoma conorhini]|uniref:Uncharacterized protein n=1 Tax=Trypanosoma conorhini TaxID=83891 RepID=A0A3R7N095_9TRYP|nr:uncharacterized protein Tco025E_02836 [Trypanosoma conorhini]RNF23309.1 hypothetical protein Tco025E_02836 [Trypanosoma conorhini]
MSCVDAVRHDVDVAKRLAASFDGLAPAEALRRHSPRSRPFAVGDLVQHPSGKMTVAVRLERVVAGGAQLDPGTPPLVVCVEWDVIFSVAYPKEPCLWQLSDGRQTSTGPDAERSVVRLRSFLMEEVLARLPKPKKTYLDACLGDAGGGPAYRRATQAAAAAAVALTSQTELAAGIAPVEVHPALGGGGSNGNKHSGGVRQKQKNGRGSGAVGVAASPFLSDFAFLSSWWAALELDVGCVVPARQHFLMGHVSSGNMTSLEEELGGSSYPRQGRGMHFLDEVGGSRVQRAGRGFAAVFMPRGDVIAWGMRRLPRSTMNSEEEADGEAAPGTTQPQILQAESSGVVPHNCGVGWSGYRTGYMEAAGQHGYHSQHPPHHCDQHSRRAQQALRMTSVRSDLSGAVLPSLLVPSNVLRTDAYELNDVCLYAENPAAALCLNARISRDGKMLNSVSNLFLMLRHLVKGVSPHASLRYALQLLVPALHELVKALQKQRRPFWAGVAICCLLLPAVLNDRPTPFDLTAHLIDPVESYRCVSLVAMIFAAVGSNNKFREAELARDAIMSAYRAKQLPQPLASTTGERAACAGGGDAVVHASHLPITECAVCGLPLLRGTRRGPGGVAASASTSNSATSDDALLLPAKNEGCIVVQCAYCGHGGHVAHIIAWWEDKNVSCCPMGCDCRCVY